MVNERPVVAIVPARGGSKSIPHKNVRSFAGHPLLAYSIAAGLRSERVDRVIVSTDEEEIAGVARKYGAEVPFLRPADLARDDTLDLPVFEHALHWLKDNEGMEPSLVVQLRPTSPLRPPGLVDRAIEMLLAAAEADSLRGVVPSGQNPYKMWRMTDDRRLQPLLIDGPPEAYNQPRQSLPPTYWQTGHIDVIRSATILEKGSMSGDHILGIEIDRRFTADIDSEADWHRAESLLLDGRLEVVDPGTRRRPLPADVKLVVLDFDGVLTDNRVWVDGDGHEWVAANRSDGWGIAQLKGSGIPVVVLSTETDPVVAARCGKLGIEAVQGIVDKPPALRSILESKQVEPASAVFVGNDTNDTPCFGLVGCALAPADARPAVRRAADRVLKARGGHGAVRELAELVLEGLGKEGV
jgi:YrbI family 3-deoxy-D-manno-octulosonate 8-phosphate phosphatase